VLLDDADGLAFVANLATIPIHAWASRIHDLEKPDWTIIDFDAKQGPKEYIVPLALATHRLIYLLLVLAPLAGWLQASASGLSVNWFGLFQVPDLVTKSRALAELFRLAHLVCVALLAALVAGHVAAALRHALLLRDGVLHRMLPWSPRARR